MTSDLAARFGWVARVWRERAAVMESAGIDADLSGRTVVELRAAAGRVESWPDTLERRGDQEDAG